MRDIGNPAVDAAVWRSQNCKGTRRKRVPRVGELISHLGNAWRLQKSSTPVVIRAG